MKFKDLVLKNRSYRGFDRSRKVTREELLEMVDCARLTASSVNQQPLKYYLAYDEETVAKIQAETYWARALPDMHLPHKGKEPTAFIVICQDTDLAPSTVRFQKDDGIVAQTILLAATDMGLGGCMIGNFNSGKVQKTLGLAENLEPVLIVAIGKPDETVKLVDVEPDGSTDYYRDADDVHYVPKRKLKDIVID